MVSFSMYERLNTLLPSLALAPVLPPGWAQGKSGSFRLYSISTVVWSHLSLTGRGAPHTQLADCWVQLCTDNCIHVPCTIWLGKRVAQESRLLTCSQAAAGIPLEKLHETKLPLSGAC